MGEVEWERWGGVGEAGVREAEWERRGRVGGVGEVGWERWCGRGGGWERQAPSWPPSIKPKPAPSSGKGTQPSGSWIMPPPSMHATVNSTGKSDPSPGIGKFKSGNILPGAEFFSSGSSPPSLGVIFAGGIWA